LFPLKAETVAGDEGTIKIRRWTWGGRLGGRTDKMGSKTRKGWLRSGKISRKRRDIGIRLGGE